MTSRELSEWVAYDKVYGIPDPHFGPAMIATVLCQINGNRRAKIADFYPIQKRKAAQTSMDHKAIAQAFTSIHRARAEAKGRV